MNSARTILLLLSIFLPGCRVLCKDAVPTAGHYYLNPDKDLSSVGKVALLELDNNSSYPQMAPDVTEALFQALQKRQIFSVTIVRRNDAARRSLQLNSSCPYTFQQLSDIRRTFKCNAVLAGTITEFQPYPHMVIGLRLKLVDLKDGQLLWALEQVWDTADKTTEYRTKDYFRRQVRSDSTPLREHLTAVSPIKFIKFVAHDVSETLRDGSAKPAVITCDSPSKDEMPKYKSRQRGDVDFREK